jgi:hypothetical protein
LTNIRRVRTKTYIHDSEDYCVCLVSLINDEELLKSLKIAVIAKDAIIVKVVAARLQCLGLEISEILKRVTIHSTNGIATRQITKAGFKVHNEIASDEEGAGLPTLLASVDEYDLIIGNPAQQGEEVSRNNSWIQQIVKKCLSLEEESPLAKGGILLLGAPFSLIHLNAKKNNFSGLADVAVEKIELGHEFFFPSGAPRIAILARRTEIPEDHKCIVTEFRGRQYTLPWGANTVIAKSGHSPAIALLSSLQGNESWPIISLSSIHSTNQADRFFNDRRSSSVAKPKGYPIPVWDWRRGEPAHSWVTDVEGKNHGVGVKKVISRISKVPPLGIHIDVEGDFAVTENCVSWEITSEDDANNIFAFFETNIWKRLVIAFKAGIKTPGEILAAIPKISPMTDDNIANELGFDNDLRVYIDLSPAVVDD